MDKLKACLPKDLFSRVDSLVVRPLGRQGSIVNYFVIDGSVANHGLTLFNLEVNEECESVGVRVESGEVVVRTQSGLFNRTSAMNIIIRHIAGFVGSIDHKGFWTGEKLMWGEPLDQNDTTFREVFQAGAGSNNSNRLGVIEGDLSSLSVRITFDPVPMKRSRIMVLVLGALKFSYSVCLFQRHPIPSAIPDRKSVV